MTNTSYDYHDFSKRLERVLKRHGVSVAELARLTGKRKYYLSSLLEKDANPTLKTVSIITNALEIPIEELICSEKEELTPPTIGNQTPEGMLERFSSLDPESQSLVVDFINMLYINNKK